MLATLKNVSRQPVTIILDHAAFKNRDSGWSRGTVKLAKTDDQGSRVVSEVRRAYPGQITLMPGQSETDLHPAIQHCLQVPALIARRVLALTFTDADEQPETQHALKQQNQGDNR